MRIPNEILQDVYATNTVLDAAGKRIPVRENVAAENAEGVYRAVLVERASRVLEIGMANGITSLAVLTALNELGSGGQLVSVDPFQLTDWQSIGVLNVERAGFSESHALIAEPDFLALPALLRDGETFDFVYVDGWHNFDYTLLDFFYADKMLRVGGIVGFNDCDWKGVLRALRFVERHRHYEQVDFGLLPRWGTRTALSAQLRRVAERVRPGLVDQRLIGPLLGRRREDRYFRKLDRWEPPHGFWASLG